MLFDLLKRWILWSSFRSILLPLDRKIAYLICMACEIKLLSTKLSPMVFFRLFGQKKTPWPLAMCRFRLSAQNVNNGNVKHFSLGYNFWCCGRLRMKVWLIKGQITFSTQLICYVSVTRPNNWPTWWLSWVFPWRKRQFLTKSLDKWSHEGTSRPVAPPMTPTGSPTCIPPPWMHVSSWHICVSRV